MYCYYHLLLYWSFIFPSSHNFNSDISYSYYTAAKVTGTFIDGKIFNHKEGTYLSLCIRLFSRFVVNCTVFIIPTYTHYLLWGAYLYLWYIIMYINIILTTIFYNSWNTTHHTSLRANNNTIPELRIVLLVYIYNIYSLVCTSICVYRRCLWRL